MRHFVVETTGLSERCFLDGCSRDVGAHFRHHELEQGWRIRISEWIRGGIIKEVVVGQSCCCVEAHECIEGSCENCCYCDAEFTFTDVVSPDKDLVLQLKKDRDRLQGENLKLRRQNEYLLSERRVLKATNQQLMVIARSVGR